MIFTQIKIMYNNAPLGYIQGVTYTGWGYGMIVWTENHVYWCRPIFGKIYVKEIFYNNAPISGAQGVIYDTFFSLPIAIIWTRNASGGGHVYVYYPLSNRINEVMFQKYSNPIWGPIGVIYNNADNSICIWTYCPGHKGHVLIYRLIKMLETEVEYNGKNIEYPLGVIYGGSLWTIYPTIIWRHCPVHGGHVYVYYPLINQIAEIIFQKYNNPIYGPRGAIYDWLTNTLLIWTYCPGHRGHVLSYLLAGTTYIEKEIEYKKKNIQNFVHNTDVSLYTPLSPTPSPISIVNIFTSRDLHLIIGPNPVGSVIREKSIIVFAK